MFVWYAFVVVAVTPPVCDSAMRASGDMVRPFLVMLIIAIMNIVLDPLLIYGYWIFPQMGIQGAAVATIISRGFGMVATLSFAHFHHKLISFKYESAKELIASWKGILKIGLPSTTVQLMPQFLRTIFTALVSSAAGAAAVAAIAVGQRVESFVTLIIYGLGLSLVPLAGQNWGAGKYERVYETRRKALIFAVIYCVVVFLISLPLAKPVSSIFTDDPEVILYSAQYLWIMIVGLVGLTMTTWMSRMFTTIGRPLWTVIINVAGTLGVIVPLAYIGRAVYGYIGILTGVALGQIIVGLAAAILAKHKMRPDVLQS
jgi:putative MATE family efflux protein